MKLIDIYKKYEVPPNLKEHMVRVYGVVKVIEKHWTGGDIDWSFAEKAALLHDLGNIVKFDFDKHPEFLGHEQKNLDHWKEVKKKVTAKYGSDDNEVTLKMLKEIGIPEEALEIVQKKSFKNSLKTEKVNNWPLKVLYYADLRTLPFGIGSLEERISDARGRMPSYTSRPDFEESVKACKRIEGQIQRNLDIPVSEINNELVNREIKDFDKEIHEFDI